MHPDISGALRKTVEGLNSAVGHVASNGARLGLTTEQILGRVQTVLEARDLLLRVVNEEEGAKAVEDLNAPLCKGCTHRITSSRRGSPQESCDQRFDMDAASRRRTCPGYTAVTNQGGPK